MIVESRTRAALLHLALIAAFACVAQPALARVAANVVLNAFSTDESGRVSAITAAAELPTGTTRESNVAKSTGLVRSTTTLPSSFPAYWLSTSATAE